MMGLWWLLRGMYEGGGRCLVADLWEVRGLASLCVIAASIEGAFLLIRQKQGARRGARGRNG